MNGCAGLDPACPCGTFVHPWVIENIPGLSVIAARSGDYEAYRHALLQSLPGETELSRTEGGITTLLWRPTAEGDLALQLVEWWAYLADILTFYNERITDEVLSRHCRICLKASIASSHLLGYRPQPALGAKGTLAALVNRARPVLIPQGLQIQSKPGPGKQPQIFELDAATTVSQPDSAPALPQAVRRPPSSAPSDLFGHRAGGDHWSPGG